MKNLLFLLFLIIGVNAQTQVAISTNGSLPDNSAMLDVKSTNKGMLVPRLTTAQRTAVSSPASGLLVFDSTTGSFWFYNSGGWIELVDQASTQWVQTGSNISYSAGNVGIGDNTPASALTVGNGDKFQVESSRGSLAFNDDSASIRFPASAGGNTPMIYMYSGGTQNTDRMVLGHSPGFPKWGLEYKDTTDMFFMRSSSGRKFSFNLGSGYMGIGTENPAFPLDMVGRARIRADGNPNNLPGIWFSSQDNEFDRGLIGMSRPDSSLGIWSQHLGKWAIEFQLMREPRIGINILPGSPARAELHLYHTNFGGSNDGVRIQNEGSNLHYWNLYTSNNTGMFEFYKSGIKRATIDPASGAYTAVSDSRLKTNVSALNDVLPAVMNLEPKTYQFTDGSERFYSGFMAQDLQKVFPQFVYYGGDDQVVYTVDYAGMSVVALKAIQEQQLLIEKLLKRIEILERSR